METKFECFLTGLLPQFFFSQNLVDSQWLLLGAIETAISVHLSVHLSPKLECNTLNVSTPGLKDHVLD